MAGGKDPTKNRAAHSTWKDRRPGRSINQRRLSPDLTMERPIPRPLLLALALLLAAPSPAGAWRRPSIFRRQLHRPSEPGRRRHADGPSWTTTAAADGVDSAIRKAVLCARGGAAGTGPCIGIELGECLCDPALERLAKK